MNKQTISIRAGFFWVALTQIIRIIIQLISVVVLARLINPADYGLMAMAGVITVFASLFRDFGTAAAIIQTKDIDTELKSSVFWFNVALGLALSVLVAVSSSFMAQLFSEPRLAKVLLILSPVFFVASLGIVQQALLERVSNFKAIAYIEVISSFTALITAIFLAFNDWGVYALIAQTITGIVVSGIMLWAFSHWRPSLLLTFASIKKVWRFSSNLFIFNFVNYFQRNTDSMLIGRFLGSVDLGYYNLAYRILLLPLQSITFAISRASFPVYSRHQDDLPALGKHYLEMLGTIAFFTAPLMSLIWVVREPLILTALGESWLPAADVLAFLAPVGFFQSLVSTSGSVLNSIGRSDILRNLGLIGVPFLILSMLAGLPWGIVGVAAGYCIANFLWIYPTIKTVLTKFNQSFFSFVKITLKPVIISAFGITLTILPSTIISGNILITLIYNTFIFILIYIFLYYITDRENLFKNLKFVTFKNKIQKNNI